MNQEIFSVRKDTTELSSILMDGVVLRHGEPWIALPREVVSGSRGIESVIFEAVRVTDFTKPSTVSVWLTAIRPESLTITFTTCLAVLLNGLSKSWEVSGWVGISALLGAMLFQVSMNLFNDVEDHLRLIDLPGTPGGSGVIQKGWLNARTLKILGYISLGIGIFLGLPAVILHPQLLLGIAAMGAFGVLAYSNWPFGIKYRTLGDFSILVLGGPLLALGFSGAAFGRVDLSVVTLGWFFGLLAWAIYHANNLQAIDVDLSYEVRTLASKLGHRKSCHLFAALYVLAYLLMMIGGLSRTLPLEVSVAVLLGIPWVFGLVGRVYRASGPASALLNSVRSYASKLHFFLGVLVCGGFLAHLLIRSLFPSF